MNVTNIKQQQQQQHGSRENKSAMVEKNVSFLLPSLWLALLGGDSPPRH